MKRIAVIGLGKDEESATDYAAVESLGLQVNGRRERWVS